MKTTGIFSLMVAVLIAAISIGLTSCNKEDDKEPEIDLSGKTLTGRWYYYFQGSNPKHYFEFNSNGTYSYVSENETINGFFKITEGKKISLFQISTSRYFNFSAGTVLDDVEVGSAQETILFNMLASGSNDFDQLRVYVDSSGKGILVQTYLVNEPVQTLGRFNKNQ